MPETATRTTIVETMILVVVQNGLNFRRIKRSLPSRAGAPRDDLKGSPKNILWLPSQTLPARVFRPIALVTMGT